MLQSGQSLLTFEELVALPYLDAVIREVLRVCPPVFALIRTATSDDLIPLGEPIIAKDGRSASSLPVKKGQLFRILMGIHSIQRDRSIFGEDADDCLRSEVAPEAALGTGSQFSKSRCVVALETYGPGIVGEEGKGVQMPLRIRKLVA